MWCRGFVAARSVVSVGARVVVRGWVAWARERQLQSSLNRPVSDAAKGRFRSGLAMVLGASGYTRCGRRERIPAVFSLQGFNDLLFRLVLFNWFW